MIEENYEQTQEVKELRTKLAPEIDSQILNRFEFIVKNKCGIGIVQVINSICEGCNIAVTPQVISEIREYEHIVYCTNCSRILYIPERINIF